MTTSVTTPVAARDSDTGTTRGRPQLPRWRDVLREQLRALAFILRRPAQLGAALAVLATITITIRIVSRDLPFDLNAEPSPVYGVIGALLPIAVWARDERFGPGFLWTLPVDRLQHALTKVFAGWIWLVAVVTLSVLWLIGITVASGGNVLPVETLHLLDGRPPSRGGLDPSTLRSVSWSPGAVIGLVPFTAATTTYLLSSALWLGTRQPIRWIIGVVLFFLFASAVSHAASTQLGIEWLSEGPEKALQWVVQAQYGFDALLTARTATLDAGMALESGERVSVWRAVPDLADWGIATALWGAASVIAILAAALRHRERRGK